MAFTLFYLYNIDKFGNLLSSIFWVMKIDAHLAGSGWLQ